MGFLRKIIWILAAALMLTVPVSASSAKMNRHIRNLLYYYQYYQDAAQVDIDRILGEMEELDPEEAQKWASIMDYWSWLNRDMVKNPDVLPDGLPEDESLCIVVLGYALEDNGTMKPELIGRLTTALKSAEKYPNAYILCTGGGEVAGFTEAGQMSRWLVEQGVDRDRIIQETNSGSTPKNARNSVRILKKNYPQIRSLAIVTSDYHIRRGCLVFHTESVLTDAGLEIAGNAVYTAGRDVEETVTYQAYEISRLAPVGYEENAPEPPLTQLESITALCEVPWEAGQELAITVTAHYSGGYTRDVSEEATFSGVDFTVAGTQTMTVRYTDGIRTRATEVEIEILTPETVPETTLPPTEAPAEAATEPIQEEIPRRPSLLWCPVLAAAALILGLLLLKRRSK